MGDGKPLSAVLFDFDGTLGDSYPAITASVNHVRGGYGLPPLDKAEVRRHVGYSLPHLLNRTVAAGAIEANITAYRVYYASAMGDGTRLLPGAVDVLRALRERGIRLGVCSNKSIGSLRPLLVRLGVQPFLDVVLGPEDVPRPKPAPDMLHEALTRLDVPAAETLYVGDMVVDVETARAAGVSVWVVPTGSDEVEKLERARPDRLLRDLDELRILLTAP